MNKKKYEIVDMRNRKYVIEDFKKFYTHINLYHSQGDSIHEENGFLFFVNDEFRENLKQLLD